jgi:hypothetical protein
MPRIRPPHPDGLLGPEGRRQQPETGESLAPLTVVDVGLGALGGTLHLAGGDQQPLEACACEQVVAW